MTGPCRLGRSARMLDRAEMSQAIEEDALSPEQVRRLIMQTGLKRKVLVRLLGYNSDNSLRQCETGKAVLPADKAVWLRDYAALRSHHAAIERAWLQANPSPNAKQENGR